MCVCVCVQQRRDLLLCRHRMPVRKVMRFKLTCRIWQYIKRIFLIKIFLKIPLRLIGCMKVCDSWPKLATSSSSCRAISTDISDPLSPPLPIVHCFRQVLRATRRILIELLQVGSSWSPWLWSAMWRGPWEYITYELVPTSTAVSCMSGSSNLDSFRDGGRWPYGAAFWGVASRTCSILLAAFLCSYHHAFPPSVSLVSM